MSVEAWNASQGMLDHWAFLDREGQHEDDRSRTVLDSEPVLDLLSEWFQSRPLRRTDNVDGKALDARTVALLRTHGRLK